jgi:hypothetical protein
VFHAVCSQYEQLDVFEQATNFETEGFFVAVVCFGELFEHDPGYAVVSGAGDLMDDDHADVGQNYADLSRPVILDQSAVVVASLDFLVLQGLVVVVGQSDVGVDVSKELCI